MVQLPWLRAHVDATNKNDVIALQPPGPNVEEQGQALPAVAWWIRLIWHLDEPLHAQTSGLQSIEVVLKRPVTARESHAPLWQLVCWLILTQVSMG